MRTIKNVLFGILGLCFFLAIYCIILSLQYTNYSEPDQNAVVSGYNQTSAFEFIYTDGAAESSQSAQLIGNFISDLPDALSRELMQTWKVVVASGAVGHAADATRPGSNHAGVTLWQYRLILINTQEDPDVAFRVFVHEFGHFLDINQGFCSKSDEFQMLFEKHRNEFSPSDTMTPEEYPTSSPQEFFAEACKEYYLSPVHLKENVPTISEYFDAVISDAISHHSWYHRIINNLIGLYRSKKQ